MKFPFGNFLLNQNSDKIFLAGGTGISVFLSYLDFLQLEGSQNNILEIFHSAKTSNEAVDQIYWNKIPKSIKISQFITNRNDKGYTGRLTHELLFSNLNRIKDVDVFICGPPQFNDYWIEKIKEHGIIPHVEQWMNKVNLV